MTPTGDELLAAVYAAPDDDDARLVYADWLQERGDPRGELIALQLAKTRGVLTEEQHARERALLAQHVREWIAPLPIRMRGVVFERGFVAACEMNQLTGFIDDRPAWSTVRSVNSVPISDRSHTHSLRDVRVGYGGILQLAKLARPLAIDTLAWNGPEYWHRQRWNAADEAIRVWSEIRVLPKLRSLALLGQDTWVDPGQAPEPRHLAWAWSSRYMPALRELSMPCAPSQLPTWLAALAPTRLAHVELSTESSVLRPRAWRLVLDRDARGQLSRLIVIAPARPPSQPRDRQAMDQVVAGVRALPPMLSRAVVQIPGAQWEAYAGPRAGLAAALARHPSATVSIEPVAGDG